MFKRILKIVSIVAACVVGGFGLVLGGMYAFGAFDQETIFPQAGQIYFETKTIGTHEGVALTVRCTNSKVNVLEIELSDNKSGVVTYPKKVTIGEHFLVFPVADSEGNNIGGEVEITARTPNQWAQAKCTLQVDVEVKGITLNVGKNLLTSTDSVKFGPASDALISASISPSRAVNPGLPSLSGSNFANKIVFYYLVDEYGYLLERSPAPENKWVAHFVVNGSNRGAAINSREINNNTFINTEKVGTFYIQAYVFDTLSRQGQYSGLSDSAMNAAVFALLDPVKPDWLIGTPKEINENIAGSKITVSDVEVDNLTVTPNKLTLYLYETRNLFARKTLDLGTAFNLGIQLNPPAEDTNHSHLDLDEFIKSRVSLSEVVGPEGPLLELGDGFIKGTQSVSVSSWYWDVLAIGCNKDLAATGQPSTTTLRIKYSNGGVIFEQDIVVEILVRSVSNIGINYKGNNFFEVLGDGDAEISIGTKNGLNTYDYFTMTPSHDTINTLKFYLAGPISYIPTEVGEYKVSFEIDKKNSEGGVTISALQDGVLIGDWNVYEFDGESYSNEKLTNGIISLNGQTGKYKIEYIYDKTESGLYPAPEVTYDGGIKYPANLQFFKKSGVSSFNAYPYLMAGDIEIIIRGSFITCDGEGNDILLIDDQDAKISANGFGSFKMEARVVLGDIYGAPYKKDNGDYYSIYSKQFTVEVTNIVQGIDVNLVAVTGDGEVINVAVGGHYQILEGNDYFLIIKPAVGTPMEVFKQAVLNGKFNFAIDYIGAGESVNGNLLSITDDLKNYEYYIDSVHAGYKLPLSILDVYTIIPMVGDQQQAPLPIRYSLSISIEDSPYAETPYTVTVDAIDIAVRSAELKFGDEVETSKSIYAYNIDPLGKVIWMTYEGAWEEGDPVNLSDLTYSFKDLNDIEISVAPEIGISVNFNDGNYGDLVAFTDDLLTNKKILTMKNIPYNESGYTVTISLTTGANKYYYPYDVASGILGNRSEYSDCTAIYTFTVYGFKISTNNVDIPSSVEGKKDNTVELFDMVEFIVQRATEVEPELPDDEDPFIEDFDITKVLSFDYATERRSAFSFDVTEDSILLTVLNNLPVQTQVTLLMSIGVVPYESRTVTFTSPYEVVDEVAALGNTYSSPEVYDLTQTIYVTVSGTKIDSQYVTYSLNSTQLATLGVTGLVTITPQGELTIKNIGKDIVITIILTINEGLGPVQHAKDITITNIWNADTDITNQTALSAVLSIAANPAVTATIKVANHNQAFNSIDISKQGDSRNQLYVENKNVPNGTFTIRSYETTETLNITLTITLTFGAGGADGTVVLQKTVTIIPYTSIETNIALKYQNTSFKLNSISNFVISADGASAPEGTTVFNEAVLSNLAYSTTPSASNFAVASGSVGLISLSESGSDIMVTVGNLASLVGQTEATTVTIIMTVPIKQGGTTLYSLTYNLSFEVKRSGA